MADEKAIGDPSHPVSMPPPGMPGARLRVWWLSSICLCSASEVDAARERANELLTESEFRRITSVCSITATRVMPAT